MATSWKFESQASLLTFLESGADEAHLTFAAEEAGKIADSALVVPTLIRLLDHVSAPVREGAVYGLERHVETSKDARDALKRVVVSDASPGVRDAAREALQLVDD